MPVRKEYTAEFKKQAVKFVFEEIAVDESRSAACERLGPKLSVKPATLYNWVKTAAVPAASVPRRRVRWRSSERSWWRYARRTVSSLGLTPSRSRRWSFSRACMSFKSSRCRSTTRQPVQPSSPRATPICFGRARQQTNLVSYRSSRQRRRKRTSSDSGVSCTRRSTTSAARR